MWNRYDFSMKTPLILTLVITSWFAFPAHASRLLVKSHGQWSVVRGDLSAFRNDPDVEWVEQDQWIGLEQPEIKGAIDPKLDEQWTLKKSGVFEAIQLANQTSTNANAEILVAVVDTGVDLQHPDLKANLFINRNEIPNNGIDDDRNGFVDDVQGWNFNAKEDDPKSDPISEQANAQDDFNHGTHVAGTIGAIQNNGIGISGIAPKVKILPVRWMSKGLGWGSDAIASIRYAVKMGAKVINASWGGIGYSKALEEAVREAESKGVLFVVSAGNNKSDNDSTPRHPANLRYTNVIAVANIDAKDGLAKSSNWGRNMVELAAPGEDVISTVLKSGYSNMSGTSMAASHLSGVAALLLSVNPKLSAQDLKLILIQTATPVAALNGKTITGGRVNALEAMKKIIAQQHEEFAGTNPFYEFGQIDPERFNSNPFINPDRTEAGISQKGLSLKFVRMVKGVETPVSGIKFRAQLRSDSNAPYQQYVSDQNGMITDSECAKNEYFVTTALETNRYGVVSSANNGSTFDLVFKLKCGIPQKFIFDETTEAGEVIGIWQVLTSAEKKLAQEVGIDFWKYRVDFMWPEKGDYFDGARVHLTLGHQWDVVSHEMGHAIYHQAKIGQMGGGEHYIDRCYEDTIAFSEGWASFYAAWLNFDLKATDPGFEYMVPRRAPIKVENIPADVCGQPTNEWRVTGFLWDLIDQHSDTETHSQSFSELWKLTSGTRASSVRNVKKLLLEKGWNSASIEGIWKLNFPAE
jgi:subtilisin family serine protease